MNIHRHLLTMWGCCLAVLAWVTLWEQRPLASIGIVGDNYLAWRIGAALGVTVLASSVLSVIQASRVARRPCPKTPQPA